MTPKANIYALAALKDRRATIASEILEFERKLRHLRESLVHVDATLRILDLEIEPDGIPNKRPIRRVKLFRSGELGRMILDALRQAHNETATTAEIVSFMLAAGGHGEGARRAVAGRVRGNLAYLEKRGKVVKSKDGKAAVWRLV